MYNTYLYKTIVHRLLLDDTDSAHNNCPCPHTVHTAHVHVHDRRELFC